MPSLEQIDHAFDLRHGAEAVIALLIGHKQGSPQAVDPNYPLPTLYYALSLVYLRNVAISDADIDSNCKYIRDQFEKHSLIWHHGWRSPSECCINGPAWVRSKKSLSLLPREWNLPRDKEKTIKKFYEEVLLIWQPDYTWRTAISEIEYQRAREASAVIDDVSLLYFALQQMTLPLGYECGSSEEERLMIDSKNAIREEERDFVRAAFYSQSWIAVEQNKCVKWLRRVDCALWEPRGTNSGKVDLSRLRRYDNLMDFFINIVNVDEFPRKILEISPIPPDPAQLRSQRAALVDVDRTILANLQPDPYKALTLPYFPVFTTATRVELMPADDYFLIADDPVLELMFRDQVPIVKSQGSPDWASFLNKDATLNKHIRSSAPPPDRIEIKALLTLPILETEFERLQLNDKYISNNVIERVIRPPGAKQRKLHWDIAGKAEAIVSIAAQFKSPRAGNTLARRKLLNILKEGEMFAVEGAELMAGLFTTVPGSYSMGPCFDNEQGFVVPSTRLPVSVSIDDSGMTFDKLFVHIAAEEAEIRRAYGDGLPRRLLHWLMVNPETMQLNQKLNGRAETILRSVLCALPGQVNALLEEKKIYLVGDLDLQTGLMNEESESEATTTNASNPTSMTPESLTPADSPLDQNQQQYSPEATAVVLKTGPMETPVTQPANVEEFPAESKHSPTTTPRRLLVPKSRRRSTPHSPEEAEHVSSILSDTSTVDALASRLELLRISDTGAGVPKLCSGFSSREISRSSHFRPFSDSQSDLSTSFVFLGARAEVAV
ncbi:hypothetical protein FNAPI_11725 [Fusarium napiforme]|uniref:Uncharacterized protein n=1 Tax=Fusarium napiforme TaxID=42672 RepID=A0A8H5MQM9_9HYPO|nr:hypothetical protein FNAPI_11725 [Fusarium napiforme]